MRIAVLGSNVANVGYRLTKFLRRRGAEADLYLHSYGYGGANPDWEDPDSEKGWVKIYTQEYRPRSNRFPLSLLPVVGVRLLRELRGYDIVQTICGGLGFINLIYFKLWRMPHVDLATGSDITEVAVADSIAGRRTRASFRDARMLLLVNIHMIEIAKRLGLSNSVYFPHPIDTERFAPLGFSLNRAGFDTVFFHPTRLDWSYEGADRTLKGNDRFIRAFARYIKGGHNSLAILVDSGVDRERTRALVTELGIESNVELVPPMKQIELAKYYSGADVVIDQFNKLGAFGLITLEAMSCAKPVMVYIKDELSDQVYPERPPVLNCGSEEEIYQQLVKAGDKEYREQLGRQAREWILNYHHWEKVIDQLICHYEAILGPGFAR